MYPAIVQTYRKTISNEQKSVGIEMDHNDKTTKVFKKTVLLSQGQDPFYKIILNE